MATAVGATTPQATGFVASVQAAYTGSKVQWVVNGFFAVLGKIASTAWAWKLPIAGAVIVGAAVYHREAIAKYFGIECCGSKKADKKARQESIDVPPVGNNKDDKQPAKN